MRLYILVMIHTQGAAGAYLPKKPRLRFFFFLP